MTSLECTHFSKEVLQHYWSKMRPPEAGEIELWRRTLLPMDYEIAREAAIRYADHDRYNTPTRERLAHWYKVVHAERTPSGAMQQICLLCVEGPRAGWLYPIQLPEARNDENLLAFIRGYCDRMAGRYGGRWEQRRGWWFDMKLEADALLVPRVAVHLDRNEKVTGSMRRVGEVLAGAAPAAGERA